MIETIYYDVLLLSMGMLIFMGAYLILGRIPNKLKKSVYARSRKIMGVAHLILGFVISMFYFIDMKTFGAFYSPAINLTAYFIISVLIAISFIPLLGGGRTHFTPKRIKKSLVFWITYTVLIWGVVSLCDDTVVKIYLIIAAILFLANTIGLIYLFLRTYREAVKSAENYYSDNIEVNISWMMRTVYFVIGLGLTGGFAAFGSFAPKWTAMGYMFYTIFVFSYIFISFIDFMVYYSDIASVKNYKEVDLIPEVEDKVFTLRDDTNAHIAKGLAVWVEGKNYMISGVNIQSISNKISTNRTYLSTYINSTYGLTFKDWITSLRIEEAKRLMMESSSVTVGEVAHTVGFSSPTSFTRAFTRRESVSPLKWRESR